MVNLFEKIQMYKESRFKNTDLIDKIIKNYNDLDKNQKMEIESEMYVVYRGKFDSLFLSNQYVEAIPWIDKVVNHKRFTRELLDNKNHFFVEAVKDLLIVYLENKDTKLLNQAKHYFELIEKLYLKESLNEIYEQDVKIFEALDNNGFFTETSFSVPISIKTIKESVHISLEQSNIEAEVSCISLPLKNENTQVHGSIVREQDRDSTINVSNWTVKINKYLSCEQSSSTDESFSIMQEVVCQIVNQVIDRYREKTNEYWIKKIYPTMIQGHSIKYKAEKLTFREIPFYDRRTFIFSSEQPQVSLKNEDGAFIQDPPLYKKLFLDAQTYLLTQNLSTSILLLNMAFENFTYTVVCPMIIEQSQGNYEEEFYLSPVSYDDYFLHDYLTKDQYQEAVSKGVIKPRGMSQYTIYKILYKESEVFQQQTTKSKLNKLISSVRKNRNEIVHGNFDVKTLKYNETKRQLVAFKQLVSFIQAIV